MYCSNLRELRASQPHDLWPLRLSAATHAVFHFHSILMWFHRCYTTSDGCASQSRALQKDGFCFVFIKPQKGYSKCSSPAVQQGVAIFLYSSSTTESSSGLWGGLGVEGIVNLIQICMFFGCGRKLMHTYRGNADSAQSGFVTLDSRRRPFNIHHRISLKTHSLNFWSLIKLV